LDRRSRHLPPPALPSQIVPAELLASSPSQPRRSLSSCVARGSASSTARVACWQRVLIVLTSVLLAWAYMSAGDFGRFRTRLALGLSKINPTSGSTLGAPRVNSFLLTQGAGRCCDPLFLRRSIGAATGALRSAPLAGIQIALIIRSNCPKKNIAYCSILVAKFLHAEYPA
jgi:hypothetical protein